MDEAELAAALEKALRNVLHKDFQAGGKGSMGSSSSGGTGGDGGGSSGKGIEGTGILTGIGGVSKKFLSLESILNTYGTAFAANNDQMGLAAIGVASRLDKHAIALLNGEMGLMSHTGMLTKNFQSLVNQNSALGRMGTAVNETIGFMNNTYETYKGLSDVGADFGGDLLELQQNAAGARMTLDQFANMVAKNSEKLNALGGGVTEGARAFTQVSRALFDSRLNLQLQNMGVGLEEINDFTVDYLDMQRRNTRFQNMSAQQQSQSIANYVRELDVLAKLTGKSRQEMQDELMERQSAGNVQARVRLLEMQGIEGAAEGINQMQKATEGMPPQLKAMADTMIASNGAITKSQHGTAALFGDSYNLMSDAIAAMNAGDFVKGQELMAKATAASANTIKNDSTYLSIATTKGLTDIGDVAAEAVENGGKFADALSKMGEQAGIATTSVQGFALALDAAKSQIAIDQKTAIEQPITNAITAGIATVADARAGTVDAFVESGRPILEGGFKKLADSLQMDPKVLSGVIGGAAEGLFSIVSDTAASQVSIVEKMLKDNADEFSSSQKETLQATLNKIAQLKVDYEEATTTEEKNEIAGQINELISGMSNVVKTIDATAKADKGIFSIFSEFGEGVLNGIKGIFGIGRAGGGPVFENMPVVVGEKGPEVFVPEAFGNILSNPDLQNLPSVADMNNLLPKIQPKMPAQMDQMMQAMKSSSESTALQVASMSGLSPVKDTSQSDSGGESITDLLRQTLEVNTRAFDTAQKQFRAIKGGNGNVMRGI